MGLTGPKLLAHPGSHSHPGPNGNMGPISENSFSPFPFLSKPPVRLFCRFPFPANMSYAASIKMVGDVQSYWKTENAGWLSGCPDRSGTALQSLSVRCIRFHRTFSHRHPAAEQPGQETIYFFPLVCCSTAFSHVAHEKDTTC